MLTPFGKEARKQRIDRDMTLGQMAEKLKKSPTFLTAIETGRKPVPPELIEQIAQILELNEPEVTRLRQAAELSRPSYKISVPVNTPAGGREVAALFAKSFVKLTHEDFERLRKILSQEKDEV
ncbi:MAG TPA: helix-turn-helix transcriptional regulator [Patescibacteria group bacterium]|nr:helix-turn-helix transcriptional regulator [Patescibacteria group bacterium]